MTVQQLSESTEMYLKAMAELGEGEAVAIGRLAERLSVTPVSANEMVRRLTGQDLVKHTPYKGVVLTKKGTTAANHVVRRQRLWECFLYENLQIEWFRLYELACSLEHATAPEVTDALAIFLGDPKLCPHGNPIPSAAGPIPQLDGIPLRDLPLGDKARILAIRATETKVLKHLQERAILPGREVTIIEAAPMQGPLIVRVEGRDVALGLLLAELVIVKLI
jgi:DtxR family Mn-dependent transcriptional regulator